MSATLTSAYGLQDIVNVPTEAPPALKWVEGTVQEMLAQPGEQFYLFSIRQANGNALFLRIADPYTSAPLPGVTTGNVIYDLMKEAHFRNLNVQVAYRDFGYDHQAGVNRLVIDRVILTQ
jgi:hypothetical protein